MKVLFLTVFLTMFGVAHAASDVSWIDSSGSVGSVKLGTPIILHFWASWCGPCRYEMPILDKWVKGNKNVNIKILSLDRSESKAKEFLKKNKISIELLTTTTSQSRKVGVRGLPTTVVIDSEGKISYYKVGAVDWGSASETSKIKIKLK